nr:hypothetical protein Iba_chr13bCG6620 [Ipomoea batatas]
MAQEDPSLNYRTLDEVIDEVKQRKLKRQNGETVFRYEVHKWQNGKGSSASSCHSRIGMRGPSSLSKLKHGKPSPRARAQGVGKATGNVQKASEARNRAPRNDGERQGHETPSGTRQHNNEESGAEKRRIKQRACASRPSSHKRRKPCGHGQWPHGRGRTESGPEKEGPRKQEEKLPGQTVREDRHDNTLTEPHRKPERGGPRDAGGRKRTRKKEPHGSTKRGQGKTKKNKKAGQARWQGAERRKWTRATTRKRKTTPPQKQIARQKKHRVEDGSAGNKNKQVQ